MTRRSTSNSRKKSSKKSFVPFDEREGIKAATLDMLYALEWDHPYNPRLIVRPRDGYNTPWDLATDAYLDKYIKKDGWGYNPCNRSQAYAFYRDWLYEHGYIAEGIQFQLCMQEYWEWLAENH